MTDGPSYASGPGRGIWMVAAVICVAAAGGVGYFVGHSGGADIGQAKAEGARAGRERAATDRRRYRAAYAKGRKTGYRQAYRTAVKQASSGAGQ
jgi:hypothetical protein